MKNVKKIAALGLSATMAMGMLPATLVSADEATGTVYYLNFKPEQADQWKELAEKYTEETGVQVDVVTQSFVGPKMRSQYRPSFSGFRVR